MAVVYRIGSDENGLGARLGPLVVTAVLARVDDAGQKTLARRLPKAVRRDLDDSKVLVSHRDCALGEAWARALFPGEGELAPRTPAEVVSRLTLESIEELRSPCPRQAARQCWSVEREGFSAPEDVVARLRGHLTLLQDRGVQVLRARSSLVCTKILNRDKLAGRNRFISDLHAMERLVLAFRRETGVDVTAVCGKVGGMGEYSKFFGPLGGWLHAVLEQGRARSAYCFPGVGEIHFVRDADARDPLVMLASLVGKYVREVFMERVARFYVDEPGEAHPSGYSDPVTTRFVEATALLRRRRNVPDGCFERVGDGADG